MHSLTAHPFTISSLPRHNGLASAQDAHEMVFYVHPRGGYTGRLATLARQKPNGKVRLSLDGPYGGMKDRSLGEFERVIIISGGAGAGFVLPVLEDVLRRGAAREAMDVKVVFSTSKGEHAVWFHEQVEALLTEYMSTGVRIDVHVTGRDSEGSLSRNKKGTESSEETGTRNGDINHEKEEASSSEGDDLTKPTITGRPDTKAVVAQAVESFTGAVGIAVCGPESMLFDVRNAVAGAQGKVGLGGPTEVYLYSEHFGW